MTERDLLALIAATIVGPLMMETRAFSPQGYLNYTEIRAALLAARNIIAMATEMTAPERPQ